MTDFEERKQALYEAFLRLKTPKDVEVFLADLCTRKEVEQMVMRLSAAALLIQGATYNDVMDRVDISSATLSRVSGCVQYGEGYNRFALSEEEKEKLKPGRADI